MRNLACYLVFATAAQAAAAQPLVGLWEFNDSLAPTVGSMPAVNFGAFTFGDVTTPNGTQRAAIWTDQTTRFEIPNPASRGISGLTENYTLVMDISMDFTGFFAGFDNRWGSIYDTRSTHDDGDGELFFRSNFTSQLSDLGNDGQYAGQFASNVMYRVVVVSDTTDPEGIDVYVNGVFVRSIADRDTRWFLNDAFGINEDDDGETKPGALNLVGLYDGVLAPSNIAVLGSAGAAVPMSFGANISGTVTLQDYNGDVSTQPVMISVTDGTQTWDFMTNLDANGGYSIKVPTTGTFDIRIKAAHWLTRAINGVVVTTNTTGVNAGLINGDVDGDNEVGGGDLSELAASFLLSLGDEGFNPNADLDGDNEVGSSDLSILAANFLTSGD